MYRYIGNDKVAAPTLRSARLPDQLRERIRYLHYSLLTEKEYLLFVTSTFDGTYAASSSAIRINNCSSETTLRISKRRFSAIF